VHADIPIVDAAVAKTIPNGTDVYDPYTAGVAAGAFVRNPDGSEYIGKVWPGYTVFPDWYDPVLLEHGAWLTPAAGLRPARRPGGRRR
jgi:alpha-glucosidase